MLILLIRAGFIVFIVAISIASFLQFYSAETPDLGNGIRAAVTILLIGAGNVRRSL